MLGLSFQSLKTKSSAHDHFISFVCISCFRLNIRNAESCRVAELLNPDLNCTIALNITAVLMAVRAADLD